MPDVVQPIVPSTLPCKCCDGESEIFGVVDFNKRAEFVDHAREPVGIPIYYHRCGDCGFVFTTAMDHFTPSQFSTLVYNDEYAAIDGDYVHIRPRRNMLLISKSFEHSKDIRILDYGCGNGELVRMLREAGFTHVDGYDPFVPEFSRPIDGRRYDLILCFEVAEHSPRPREIFAEMEQFLEPDGLVIFSTMFQPQDIADVRVGWWYIAPRNGHVSIYTPEAMRSVAQERGLQLSSFSECIHVLHRGVPEFARHLFAVDSASV